MRASSYGRPDVGRRGVVRIKANVACTSPSEAKLEVTKVRAPQQQTPRELACKFAKM